MSEVEAWITIVALEGVEAYKASKDYHDERIKYSTMTYLIGKDEVRSKVAIHFPGLDLTFLDMESKEEDDDKSALELRANVDPPAIANPPPLT